MSWDRKTRFDACLKLAKFGAFGALAVSAVLLVVVTFSPESQSNTDSLHQPLAGAVDAKIETPQEATRSLAGTVEAEIEPPHEAIEKTVPFTAPDGPQPVPSTPIGKALISNESSDDPVTVTPDTDPRASAKPVEKPADPLPQVVRGGRTAPLSRPRRRTGWRAIGD